MVEKQLHPLALKMQNNREIMGRQSWGLEGHKVRSKPAVKATILFSFSLFLNKNLFEPDRRYSWKQDLNKQKTDSYGNRFLHGTFQMTGALPTQLLTTALLG